MGAAYIIVDGHCAADVLSLGALPLCAYNLGVLHLAWTHDCVGSRSADLLHNDGRILLGTPAGNGHTHTGAEGRAQAWAEGEGPCPILPLTVARASRI